MRYSMVRTGTGILWRLCCLGFLLALVTPVAGVAPREAFRLPFSSNPLGFQKEWLVCGPFPMPDARTPSLALAQDFLAEQGGEAAIRPVAGMRHRLPDGGHVAWHEVISPADRLDFLSLLPGPREFVIGYAYTTVYRPMATDSTLAVGSDDGVKVWVNGLVVLDHAVERPVTTDEDRVPIRLHAGVNTILLKVEQRTGGWGACLRIFDTPVPVSPNRHTNHKESLTVTLSFDPDDGELSALPICTRGFLPLNLPVRVQVVAPGGRLVAEQEVRSGHRARFRVKSWADGPYEVRCQLREDASVRLFYHITWFKGDPLAAARDVVGSAPRGTPQTPDEIHHAFLAEYLTYRLGPDLQEIPGEYRQYVFSALMEYAELAQQRRGGPGPDHHGGFVRLAYRDPIDGSPQFGRVYLPPDYTPTRTWPLVVCLHGKLDSNPEYLRWGNMLRRYDDTADRYHAIVLHPHGRGNTFYQGIGEWDVLRCLAMTMERFAVDADRVYLTGFSMGGAGSWHVGTHYPELFAALGPISGGREFRVTTDAPALATLSPAQWYRLERRKSSFVNAESLLTTPVFVNHGTMDTSVPIGISRYGVGLLQRWGYAVQYWEHAGKGHAAPIGCEDTLMEWLLAHRRVANPRVVRIRAADLRTARAHWARIERREHPAAFLCLEAAVTGPNTITLTTENVLQVTLSPGTPLIDPTRPLQVIWNGAAARTVPITDGRVTLCAEGYAPATVCKSPAVDGPISDLYNTPFAIVQGTISPDPAMRAQCAQAAQAMADAWTQEQHWPPRFFSDTAISDEDAARYSLLLIGGPDENAVARRLADRIPLRVTTDAITIDTRTFFVRDAAVQLVYPSPLHPERYVVVLAATSAAGMQYRGLLNSDVDFCLVDGQTSPWVAGGYFDRSWRFDDRFVERP